MLVVVEMPDEVMSYLLIWEMTSGRVFRERVPADFSNFNPLWVDVELGTRPIEELKDWLAHHPQLGHVVVREASGYRPFPMPETAESLAMEAMHRLDPDWNHRQTA